jgi:hypothetical protein
MRPLGLILVFAACSTENPNVVPNDVDMAQQQNNLPDLSTPGSDGPTNHPDLTMQLPCACPTGYSCDNAGQCISGDPNSLVLDVKTLKLSGTVTVNSRVPALKPACSATTVEAIVHLEDLGRGHSFDIPVLCSSSGAAFDAVVFPGDYTVTVTGDPSLSELPSQAYPMANLSLAADRSNLALDVKLVALDGTVTLNGVGPTIGQCQGDLTIELTPVGGNGAFFDLTQPCATPAAWNGQVFPGAYNVLVLGVSDAAAGSDIYAIAGSLDASTDKHGVVFDVKTYNVGGALTINGSTPNATDCANLDGSQVNFRENNTGVTATRSAVCTTNVLGVPAFRLFGGEYTVTITGNGANPLGFTEYPIRDKFTVVANQTTEVFNASTAAATLLNVGGTVTLNGVAPVSNGGCFDSAGQVTFIDAKKVPTTFLIACGTNTWTGQVPAGTYDILVSDNNDGSDLLAPGYPAVTGMSLSANKTNFAFDEKAVTVSGKVTLNSQDPATVGTCSAGGGQFEGTVRFSQDNGPSFGLPIPCSAGIFAWSGQVYAGTYTVSVDGANGTSSLPNEPYKLLTPVDASTGKSGVNIDVLTKNVAGKLTLNGMQPSTTTACNTNPNSHKANVEMLNLDQGTSFTLPVLCSSPDFSYNGVVFPGTYRISVSGAGGFSSLPKNSYLAVPKLKL